VDDTTPQAPAAPSAAHVDTPRPLARWFIRARAYFRKEVSELRRQPLLIASLVGGPLLVLLIFGATYANSNPVLRTAIVLPPGGVPGISPERLRALIGLNFQVVDITEDRASAEARLRAGELDVVQVLPADILGAAQRGEAPRIDILSLETNPVNEGWIQYLAYAEASEINKELLREQTATAQQEAGGVKLRIRDVQGELAQLEGAVSDAQRSTIQRDVRELRALIAAVLRRLPPQAASNANLRELRERLARLDVSLGEIDAAITSGQLSTRLGQIRAAQSDLGQLDLLIDLFVNTPPDVLVAPVRQQYTNLRGGAYSAVVYYAPGVLALLVQHTAITLGALALVRERLLGAFEVFRVAPVSMTQLLLGKYAGYTLFIALTAAVLLVAMLLLGVPLLGSPLLFAALLLLLTLASLGVGFLISAVAGSDSQAIQLAMLSLLLSIFFSGFFIALSSFAPPALAASYIIPMTFGVAGFHNIMLRGIAPTAGTWFGLAALSVVTFALVVAITRRQLQKA
jgi:ABC-2 type transport system permease protein